MPARPRLTNRKFLLASLLAISGLLLWWSFLAGDVQAQTTFSVESIGEQIGLGNADLKEVALNIIRWLLGFVSLLAVAYLIYGGFLWMTAAGNEQKIDKAKQTILQAVIGLVIILLAWAIVLFVARTVANVTNQSNTNGGTTGDCIGLDCYSDRTFDITAITSCAIPPEYDENVPRASNISLTFNYDVDATTVEAAVIDALDNNDPNLIIERCNNDDCTDRTSAVKPLDPQVYSGTAPTGTAGDAKAEWVAKDNTVTFYHLSFSEDESSADNLYFEAAPTKYRLTIPAKDETMATVIKDTTDPGRVLTACQQNSTGAPIVGGTCDNSLEDQITWTFSMGTDITGPELAVISTNPSSTYLSGSGTPDRDVNRFPTLAVDFNAAIDAYTITTDNFQLYQFTAPPDVNTGLGGEVASAALPGTDFVIRRNTSGTGAIMQLTSGNLLEPFTWYKAVVHDFRDMCAVSMAEPYEWVFQTNDVVPGVELVYPPNGSELICPNTEVFIKFATSMYDISSGSAYCEPGADGGSYVQSGILSPNPGRGFVVEDPYDPNNPNDSCTKYAFIPTTVNLNPDNYTVSVDTDLQIDLEGNTLDRTWSFSTAAEDNCVQPPYIDRISPTRGPNGTCISVIGNYFEKKEPGQIQETDGQGGDRLTLNNDLDQGTAEAWENNVIVNTVKAGELAADQSYPFKVTLNYSFGPLESNEQTYRLESGESECGVCLIDVSPDYGPVGTTAVLSGRGFGSFGDNSAVVYTGGDWTVNPAGWTDTIISPVQVPTTTLLGSGFVNVQTAAMCQSNQLPFTVTPPTETPDSETVPRIVEDLTCDLAAEPPVIPSPNPRRDDTQACINQVVTARFTLDMDTSTINEGNIFLQKCDPACTDIVEAAVTAPTARSFQLDPNQSLEAGTRYQVTVTTAVTSSLDVPMAAPYSWQFTTKTDGAACPIAAVAFLSLDDAYPADGYYPAVSLNPFTFRRLNYGVEAAAQAVDAECRMLDNTGIEFNWSSSLETVAIMSTATGATNFAHNPASPTPGYSDIRVTAEDRSTQFRIVYDPTSCLTSADCATNALGEACPGSICEDNHCTPVVNTIVPEWAPIGELMTIHGCWFGTYDSATSRVIYRGGDSDEDDRDGLIPDTDICGPASNTWYNEWIVRVIPDASTPDPTDDAASGAVRVVRADGRYDDGPVYTVTLLGVDALRPGICAVNPSSGPIGTATIVKGFRFGPDEPAQRTAQDQVNITGASGTPTIMSLYASWSENNIGTQIPAAAELGLGSIRVRNEGLDSSNDWPFLVSAAGLADCAIYCSTDDNCPAGQGCGLNFCCGAKPRIVSTSPEMDDTDVCRNVQVDINFDQSIIASPGAVTYTDNGVLVNGTQFVISSTLSYQPGLLSLEAPQVVSLDDGKIISPQGITADVSGTPLTFTTGDICQLDMVSVKAGETFESNSYRFTRIGELMQYRAEAISYRNDGTVINPITGVYAWSWAWISGNTGIATVVGAGDAAASPNYSNVTAVSNGQTFAQATATVTEDAAGDDEGKTVSGQGEVIVEVCNYPWIFNDTDANCDTGTGCQDFNFTLSYCRGQDDDNLLPDFSYTGSNGQVGAIEGLNAADDTRLKSIFFKETDTSRDVIGVLIFDNPDLLSPYDWFRQRFPLDSGGSTTVIGGYPALRTGTTAYIGVTDLADAELRGLMFVIDYNSNNASAATQNIYNQLLSKLIFNTNVDDLTQRQPIINDTKRVQDLASIELLLEDYHDEHGYYPKLSAGTFLLGFSTSKWPSWQQTLGNTLGQAMPQDPLNIFDPRCELDGYEELSCWNESAKSFQCPVDSHIYAYKSDDGQNYELYSQMEYTDSGSYINAAGSNPCDDLLAGSSCACFNYMVASP